MRTAIKAYADKGFQPSDFKWAHVGFLPGGKAILFDTRPDEVKPEDELRDKEAVQDWMLKQLGLNDR